METTARRSDDREPDRPGAARVPQRPVAEGRPPRARRLLQRARLRIEAEEGGREHADQIPHAVHHPLGDGAGMERLGEGLAHVAERHALAASPLRLREEPRVLERHRGLVREGLGQPQVLVGVDAAEDVAHREAAHHLPLHHQRQREHRRAEGRPRAHARGHHEAGIHPHVGGDHRLPAVHGQADHAMAGGNHDAGTVEALRLPRAADHLEIARPGLEAVEHGGAHAQGAQHHVGDALAERDHVEGLGQEAPHLREGLRGPAPGLALREEPRVADRHRRVAREQVHDLALLRGGRRGLGEGHAEHAHQLPARADRHPVVDLEAPLLPPHRGHQPRIAEGVGQQHRLPALRDRVGDPAPEGDDLRHGLDISIVVVHAALGREPVAAPLDVHQAHHAEGAGPQREHRLHDLAEDGVHIESAGHRTGQVRHLPESIEGNVLHHCGFGR